MIVSFLDFLHSYKVVKTHLRMHYSLQPLVRLLFVNLLVNMLLNLQMLKMSTNSLGNPMKRLA